MKELRSRNNSNQGQRASPGGNIQQTQDEQRRTNPSNEQDHDVGEPSGLPERGTIWQSAALHQVKEEGSSPNFTASPQMTIHEEKSVDAYPERVVARRVDEDQQLMQPNEDENPEVIVSVTDASNLTLTKIH